MKKLIYLLFVMPLFFSCGGPSACDCANLYDSELNPVNIEYSAEQYNDGTLSEDANRWVEFGRNCVLTYGDLSDFDKEIVKGATSLAWMPGVGKAIDNAKKECK
jgi:hypothetical protein